MSDYWFFMIRGQRVTEKSLWGFYTSRTVEAQSLDAARPKALQSVLDEFGEFILVVEEERQSSRLEHLDCPNAGAAHYEETFEAKSS